MSDEIKPTQVDRFFDFLSLHRTGCGGADVNLDPPQIDDHDGARVRGVCQRCQAVFEGQLSPAEVKEFMHCAENEAAFDAAARRAERRVIQ